MLTKLEISAIADLIAGAINELVSEHYGQSQEHQITSRIGDRIEVVLGSSSVNGRKFTITSQDIPDKGPGALEKKIGVDLYICISLEGEDGFSKGIFVQAKREDKISMKDLQEQCKKMEKISDASYAWIYGPSEVKVYNASDIRASSSRRPQEIHRRQIKTVLKRILECSEGDRQNAVQGLDNRRQQIGVLMDQWRAQSVVDIVIGRPRRPKKVG